MSYYTREKAPLEVALLLVDHANIQPPSWLFLPLLYHEKKLIEPPKYVSLDDQSLCTLKYTLIYDERKSKNRADIFTPIIIARRLTLRTKQMTFGI